jgi:pyruvate dehydrogenase E2 component (dihydrolipoamide acetyltransferase)
MKEIRFVDVGEGITEGHLIKWLVKDGDTVKEDQSVAQVETDKAVVNVPAPISGMIKEVAKEDSILHLGDVVAAIGAADEINGYKPGAAQPPVGIKMTTTAKKTEIAPLRPAAQKPKEAIATPSVRKLAHDLGVDISRITGTGPNGRIMENDVRAAAGGAVKQAAPAQKFSEALEEKHDDKIERVPMSMTRKAIARNMEESWKIPRATHMDLINATELWNMVIKEKPKMKEKDVHLTFLPFVIKALVEGLKENQHFNASYDHETNEIIVKKYYNIGLAAESGDGLKVVVIKDAERRSIVQIAKEIEALHKKIADKTITIDEMRDTTITITNIGSLGGGFLAVPMINPPDVAIVGIMSIRDWVFADNGKMTVGKVLPFTITFDHRVVDGAEAVKLGNAIKGYLEDPDFLEML